MVKLYPSVLYAATAYVIGFLAFKLIESLLESSDPEMRQAVDRFGKELEECLNNKVPEASKEDTEKLVSDVDE